MYIFQEFKRNHYLEEENTSTSTKLKLYLTMYRSTTCDFICNINFLGGITDMGMPILKILITVLIVLSKLFKIICHIISSFVTVIRTPR